MRKVRVNGDDSWARRLCAVMRVEYGPSGKTKVITIPLTACTDIKFICVKQSALPKKAKGRNAK